MLKRIDPLLDADVLDDSGPGHGDRPAMGKTYCVIAAGKRRFERAEAPHAGHVGGLKIRR